MNLLLGGLTKFYIISVSEMLRGRERPNRS